MIRQYVFLFSYGFISLRIIGVITCAYMPIIDEVVVKYNARCNFVI